MALLRDDVIQAYRALLGREPESEAIIGSRMAMATLEVLLTDILASEEWQRRHRPPMEASAPPGLVTDEEVAAIYGALLGRAPEDVGLGPRFRAATMTAVDLMLFVMRSPEFKNGAGRRFSRPTLPDAADDAPPPAGHGALRLPFSLEPRLVPLYHFLHIPKTAGTSLNRVFDRMFRSLVCYTSPRELAKTVREDHGFFHRYLLVTGHIDVTNPAATAAVRDNVFLAVFRDPVKRTVSLYDYIRATTDHPLHKPVVGLTLAEAFATSAQFRHVTVNAQLRTVFGGTTMRQVREALQTRSYVLGRPDALEDFVDAVARYTGFPRRPPSHASTPPKTRPDHPRRRPSPTTPRRSRRSPRPAVARPISSRNGCRGRWRRSARHHARRRRKRDASGSFLRPVRGVVSPEMPPRPVRQRRGAPRADGFSYRGAFGRQIGGALPL